MVAGVLSLNWHQADTVPRGERSQDVSNVIYQKVYLIRLFFVSGFLSNETPLIYQPARMWWVAHPTNPEQVDGRD
jgi:hypothetical protein